MIIIRTEVINRKIYPDEIEEMLIREELRESQERLMNLTNQK